MQLLCQLLVECSKLVGCSEKSFADFMKGSCSMIRQIVDLLEPSLRAGFAASFQGNCSTLTACLATPSKHNTAGVEVYVEQMHMQLEEAVKQAL